MRKALLFRSAAGCGFMLIGLLFIARIYPPNTHIGYSFEITGDDGTLLAAFLSPDDKWRLQTREGQLPDRLKTWILWKEDKHFYHHFGVNPVSVVQSGWKNLVAGKRLSGASTITMQAVKMHHRRPRTWQSKITETLYAVYWECALPKEKILGYYLSSLPFGGNVEGFRAASRIYFGKEPNRLSLAECAALVVIPNQPNRYHPIRNPENLRKKRNQFLAGLRHAGLISAEEYKSATLEPMYARYHTLPNEIPHLARHLLAKGTGSFSSTIHPKYQATLSRLFSAYAQRMRRLGINNASLLVVDHNANEVVAWIGNPDFTDNENAGQVDGVVATRSPGSTLKPIIYALALQKGRTTPKSILYDVPTEFGTYVPENFSPEYLGAVTAEDALLQSLNIPAIYLLKNIGVDTLLRYTDRLGMKLLRTKTHRPGLSMAVGGCGTSLFELVSAYAALANGGTYTPISFEKAATKKSGHQALHSGSAQMIRHILSASRRQEAIVPFVQNPSKFEGVCWKTGTSFGHRDAWCIGFGTRYTVGVWFGNFSGVGRPALNGIDVAAPVFQQIMAFLESGGPSEKLPDLENYGWKKRTVCHASGLLPGPQCLKTTEDWYLPLVSSPHICDHLKKYETDASFTYSYCPACRPQTGTKTVWKSNFPADYVQFLLAQNTPPDLPPPHNPNCAVSHSEGGVQIVSPLSGKEFFLEDKPRVRIPVRVFSRLGNYPIKVFLNGHEKGQSIEGEEIWMEFGEGVYSLTATDTQGQADKITFLVSAF